MKLEQSETLQCLVNAFAGESQARNRYTFYESVARNEGYIEMADNGPIFLTEKGREKAVKIYHRHCILTEFLEKVTRVPHAQAEENACRIEHILDEDVFQGIQKFMKESLS